MAQLPLTSYLSLQASGAVPSAAAWAIASLTAPSWRRCRPSKSATSAARTTWPTALWTSSLGSVLPSAPPAPALVPFQPEQCPSCPCRSQAQGPVLHCCGPFSRCLATGPVAGSVCKSPGLGGKVELCCNSPLCQQSVGEAGSDARGEEEASGARGWFVASCPLPLPALCSGVAGVLHHSLPEPLDSCGTIPLTWFCASSAGGCSRVPQTRSDAARARCSVLCSCRAVPSVLPVLCLRACVLPRCPSARGRANGQTPPVAQPLPLIPHTKKGKSLREGSLPHAVAAAAAVTFSPLLVARVPDPCAGCQGGAGPMERPVKDGILYVQHCKFGKVKGGFGAGYRFCHDLS